MFKLTYVLCKINERLAPILHIFLFMFHQPFFFLKISVALPNLSWLYQNLLFSWLLHFFSLLVQTRNPGVCPEWIFHLLGYILMTRVTGYFSDVFVIQLQAENSTRRDSEVHFMQMAAAVNLAMSIILRTIMYWLSFIK